MSGQENPYRASGAAPSPAEAPLYTFDQAHFVVDLEKKVPPVCLKCAARTHVERRETRFAVGTGNAAVGAMGGAGGAVIVGVARRNPALFVPLVLGALGVVGVIGWIVHKNTPRIALALPLCETCRKAWDDGERYRVMLVAALACAGALALLGKWAESTEVIAAGVVGFGLVIACAIPLKLPKRFITVARVVGTRAYLSRVAAGVPAAISARRDERAAKRAASDGTEP